MRCMPKRDDWDCEDGTDPDPVEPDPMQLWRAGPTSSCELPVIPAGDLDTEAVAPSGAASNPLHSADGVQVTQEVGAGRVDGTRIQGGLSAAADG